MIVFYRAQEGVKKRSKWAETGSLHQSFFQENQIAADERMIVNFHAKRRAITLDDDVLLTLGLNLAAWHSNPGH
jgi:hypothetical protein